MVSRIHSQYCALLNNVRKWSICVRKLVKNRILLSVTRPCGKNCRHVIHIKDKGKVCARLSGLTAKAYAGFFSSITQLGVFLLAHGRDASPLQGYTPIPIYTFG